MTEIKLVELTANPWEHRWQDLGRNLSEAGLAQLAPEIWPCTGENFPEQLKKLLASDAHICFVSQEFSQQVLKFLSQTTSDADLAGATDVLIREKGGWWPRPSLEEAFSRALTKYVGQVDFNSSALVGGCGGFAKLIVAALAKLGFPKINIADPDQDVGIAMVTEMKKKYFRVDFNFIPFQEITTLPGVHSLFLNCIPLSLENEILDELYFFNFLKANGVVLDLNLVPAKTPLIIEAEQWGARHLSGNYIWAGRDLLVLERVLGKKISLASYVEDFRKAVDTVPFDSSPILKRFRERGS